MSGHSMCTPLVARCHLTSGPEYLQDSADPFKIFHHMERIIQPSLDCKTLDAYLMSSRMQMHDDMSLGEWVYSLRRQNRRNVLPDWQRDRLDKLHFVWNVDQQTAWWHHHLHQARRYKVTLVIISLSMSWSLNFMWHNLL